MRKNATPYIILAILFGLFNVFAFVIPFDKTSTFWMAYAFTIAMFITEFIVLLMVFPQNNTPEKRFLSWPLICVGVMYFAIQTVLFFLFGLIPNIPPWIAVIIFSFVFGVALIGFVATKMSMKQIGTFDEVHKR